MEQGTHTRRGFVAHLPMRTGEGLAFEAPVKLRVNTSEGSEKHKIKGNEPVVWRGRYVHALPGGGEILGKAAPLVTEEELGPDGEKGEEG